MSLRTTAAKSKPKNQPLPRSRLDEVLRAGVDAGAAGDRVADYHKVQDTGVRGVVNGGLMPISPLPAWSVNMPEVFKPYQSVLDARNTYMKDGPGPPRALWNALPKEIFDTDAHGNKVHMERIGGDLVLKRIQIGNKKAPVQGTIFFDGPALKEHATEWRNDIFGSYAKMYGPRGEERVKEMRMTVHELRQLGKAFPGQRLDENGIAEFNHVARFLEDFDGLTASLIDQAVFNDSQRTISKVGAADFQFVDMVRRASSVVAERVDQDGAKMQIGFMFDLDTINGFMKDLFYRTPGGRHFYETEGKDAFKIKFEAGSDVFLKTLMFFPEATDGEIMVAEHYSDGTMLAYTQVLGSDSFMGLQHSEELSRGPRKNKPHAFQRPKLTDEKLAVPGLVLLGLTFVFTATFLKKVLG